MVDRRDVLKVGGGGIAGILTGVGGKTAIDAVTDYDAPEVEAEFTGIEGDIENWSLNGRIRVLAGEEDAEVTGYVDDRVPIQEETVKAGEEQVYGNLSVSGGEFSPHKIRAIVRTNRGKYTDSAGFEPGLDDFESGNGDAGNNDGGVDEGLDFGSITEEDYLEQSSKSRTRFETRLDEEYGEFLDDMHVLESGGEYFLDKENGDTDYGALRLNGNYGENSRTVGFDQSFAEDLYELSRSDEGGFTDLLEYAEGRAD
jgi:hypothetical protein